jgi:serine protease
MLGINSMPFKLLRGLIAGGCSILVGVGALAGSEFNPVVRHPVSIGPEAYRLVVGFRATADNQVVKTLHRAKAVNVVQAQTHSADVAALAARTRVHMARSRQLTPSMHVMYLQKTLYGADVDAVLKVLRADPAVKFAEVDQRRYPHTVPNDPLFQPSTDAAGQWFMLTPSTATAASDAAATDAVSAWSITTGSTGTVIADVDTGVLFTHPDLLRAGFGGRLLPGFDFVSADLDPTTSAELGTYLIANDGDGWDPDPTDPGDWIDAADQSVVDVDGHNLFPAASCPVADSSWHGTRVMGLLGALTNNDVGVAGMTWNPYLLPVRALGKCGGYDSDIIAGMQWAVGMTVNGVTDNPYPADIINLSLGGTGSCPSDYADVVSTLTGMGVLIVASAGNEGGGVDAPGNCSGVLGVAGLRNVGTKVGYSSYGAEVGVSAPAGNCVNTSGPCLRSMDTTTNSGLTVATANTYTDEYNYNVGTSFSAPVVSGIAALMLAVNANLTPAQLIARIQASASPFPQPTGLAVCSSSSGETECACPNDGSQCGAGMVNALAAVTSALRPIAAVVVPSATGLGSSVVLDAGGSTASCGRTIASYGWTTSGPTVVIVSGANASKVTIMANGSGTVTLTVTDSAGAVDTATLTVGSSGSVTAASTTPRSAGTTACPTALTVTPAVPTISETFSPESVGENATSTLTITFTNTNGFALTQSSFSAALPSNLTMPTATTTVAAQTSCTGGQIGFTTTSTGVTLTNANIPANGSCAITIPVESTQAGSYTETAAVGDLTTAPAGYNTAGASASLTVTAPSGGGGGEWDWWDNLFIVGVLLAGRRHSKRGRRP